MAEVNHPEPPDWFDVLKWAWSHKDNDQQFVLSDKMKAIFLRADLDLMDAEKAARERISRN